MIHFKRTKRLKYNILCALWMGGAFILLNTQQASAAKNTEIEVPGDTAYLLPHRTGARVDSQNGITRWTGKKTQVLFFVNLKSKGKLHLSLKMSLPDSESASIKVSVAEKSFLVKLSKTASGNYEKITVGSVDITKTGYYKITLQGESKTGKTFGNLKSLILRGTATTDIHFNTKPRRNSSSVHLSYPIPRGERVQWFYNEITVPEGADPIHSYYMACGFSRGYYGIQVNHPHERRVIFSIWDSGNEAIDRKKVKDENRVKLLAKGSGVVAHDFGNEGTGGHSHWVYSWKPKTTYRFLVHAEPKAVTTTYTAYFYLHDKKKWKLIASFRAPKDGKHLRNLYSFVENFGGSTGQLHRKAYYSNQWIVTDQGKWIELNQCRFTHDPTGRKERKDYGGGEEDGKFYLSNGGFIPSTAKYGDRFKRKPSPKPHKIKLPLAKNDLAK